MKIVVNNFIPFKGYKYVNLFGILFTRSEKTISDIDLNHESIHTAQIKELGYIGFYLWYLIEWFLKIFVYFDLHKAYRHVSFENEAYDNEKDLEYLKRREHYIFLKYI